jgi:hypothetical protein
LLGINTTGISFFYCIEIEMCKIKAKDSDNVQVEKKRAIVFSSRSPGFKLVGDDELMAGGKMYDIVEKQIVNGVTEYYAANDNDEDAVLNKLSVSNKTSTADKSLASARFKIYDVVYCLPKAKKYQARSFSKIDAARIPDAPGFYRIYFRTIISPPPELSLS